MHCDINERTIDTMLCDRLRSDLQFAAFVLSRVTRRPFADLARVVCVKANVGVLRRDGESDIEASFSHSGESTVLLIENKISASFQPNQLERYRIHASTIGPFAHVVVVAPSGYLRCCRVAVDRTDIACLSYEEMRDWLREHSAADPSRELGASLLGRGIDKWNDPLTRSGHIEAHSETELLYEAMIRICRGDLTLPPLKEKSASKVSLSCGTRSSGSYELCFDLPGWQALVISESGRRYFALNYRFDLNRKNERIRTQHLQPADVQLEFANWALRFDWFKAKLDPILPPNWYSEQRGGKALFLVRGHKVPWLDREKPLTNQRVAFDAALELVRSMFRWYQEHFELLASWARVIPEPAGK